MPLRPGTMIGARSQRRAVAGLLLRPEGVVLVGWLTALGVWVGRDAIRQNLGFGRWELGGVLAIAVLAHVIGGGIVGVVLVAIGSLLRRRRSPSRWIEPALAAVPVALLIFANIAVRLGDSVPGTLAESPKAWLYPFLLVGVLGPLASVFALLDRLPSAARLGFVALVVLAGITLPTWTDAWSRHPPAVPQPASAGTGLPARRVLLVGLDGFDWRLAGLRAAEGDLPTLAGLLRRGVAGELQPVSWLSPVAWTSTATGRLPLDHAILDFSGYRLFSNRPLVFGEGRGESTLSLLFLLGEKLGLVPRVPARLGDRQVPALWDVAGAAGKRVAVVDWLLGEPAQRVAGYFVSPSGLARHDGKEEKATGSVYPAEVAPVVASVVAEVARERPDLRDDDRESLAALRVARRLIDLDPALDLVLTYARLPDERGHRWAKSARTGRREHGRSPEWEDLEDAYRVLDGELDELLSGLDEDWVIVLVSDHGWNFERAYPGHVFPIPAGAYLFCCELPDFDTSANDFETLDIAPTVLAFLGLPISASLHGRVPFPALRASRVDSYEIEREWREGGGPSFVEEQGGEAASEEFLERLRALGYI